METYLVCGSVEEEEEEAAAAAALAKFRVQTLFRLP
jgi:hypothetical protein